MKKLLPLFAVIFGLYSTPLTAAIEKQEYIFTFEIDRNALSPVFIIDKTGASWYVNTLFYAIVNEKQEMLTDFDTRRLTPEELGHIKEYMKVSGFGDPGIDLIYGHILSANHKGALWQIGQMMIAYVQSGQ